MPANLIESETFECYPDAQSFIEYHQALGRACVVTNCNGGFIVDVYQQHFHA